MHFQDIVSTLKTKWQDYGCTLIEGYTSELGAGTLHPATVFSLLDSKDTKIVYVQPSIRPSDGCYGKNPNRLYQHHQLQVIIKPSSEDVLDYYFKTLKSIGISSKTHDLNLLEDDWKNPSIGAWGLGWEVSCNGMEVTQITYIQQMGGIDCKDIAIEITYGLERIALAVNDLNANEKRDNIYNINKDKKNIYDIPWNKEKTYGDMFKKQEYEMSCSAKDILCPRMTRVHFEDYSTVCQRLIDNELPRAAYDYCTKASHCLNLLDAEGVLGVDERTILISKVRTLANKCCNLFLELNNEQTKNERNK